MKEELEKYSKEELIQLIENYAKDWLALDGVWFQSIEQKMGMDEAIDHDTNVWSRYSPMEARRIKAFLGLSERPGLEGLEKALRLRPMNYLNLQTCTWGENSFIYRNVDCRVQTARKRKDMPFHPCKLVGLAEYTAFARAIDDRISCRCISCYPDCTESETGCAWEFSIEE